jgi:hypothetical protein
MPRRVASRKRVNQPVEAAPTKLDRLSRAYHTLGIKSEDVTNTPQITHILKQLPGKRGHDGINAAIEFLRGADDEVARKFISLWDDMPDSTRKLVPFEAFCLAAGTTTKRMLELVAGACLEQSDLAARLLVNAAHPRVVAATVRAAVQKDGHQDRKMIHLNKGFLPVSKNQTTILSGNARQTNLQLNDNSQNMTYAVTEISNIERRQERIADRFNERLGMGKSAPVLEPPPHEPELIVEVFEPEPESDWGS